MNRYLLFCNSVWLSLFCAPIAWSQTPTEPQAIQCQVPAQPVTQTGSNDPQMYLHWLAVDNLRSVLFCPPVPLKVAQAEIPTSTTGTLPEEELEITVTGTKIQPRLRNPLPQTVVNRKEFSDRSGLRGGDVLRRLPGVIIQGGPGQDKDVWLRGIDKEYTRTQIDGITVPNGGEKREFQFNQIPAFAIEEIRVIRNPTPEYESDGIAGRIDVRTRSIPTKFTSESRFGYGGQKFGNDLWNLEVGVGDRISPTQGYVGTLNYLRNPIEITKLNSNFTNRSSDVETERRLQTYRNGTFDLGFFTPTSEVHIKPIYLGLEERIEKDKITTTTPATRRTQNRETGNETKNLGGVAVTHKERFGGSTWENQIAFHSSTENKDKDKPTFRETAIGSNVFASNGRTSEIENKQDKTVDLNSKLTIPLEFGVPQELKVGVAVRNRERFRDKDVLAFNPAGARIASPVDAKSDYNLNETYLAAFVQNEFKLTDRFSALVGARFESNNLNAKSGSSGLNAGNNTSDINPSAHLLYRATDNLSLRASISRGVNRPKFDELSPFENEGNDKITIGNPNLQPTRSTNIDIGGEYSTKDLLLGANFFHRQLNGVIEEVDTGRVRNAKRIFQVATVGNGYTSGLELEQKINLGFLGSSPTFKALTLWSNQTIFLGSALTNNAGQTQPFKDQPTFLTNIGVDYNYEPWGTTLSLALTYVADRDSVLANGGRKKIDSGTNLTMAVRQKITPNFSLFFEASNLLNVGKEEREFNAAGAVTTQKSERAGGTYLAGIDWRF